MPQGITGAPPTFQRVMEWTNHHFRMNCRGTWRAVAQGARSAQRGRSESKCQFGRTSVTYIGHVVLQDGIATDPSKIEAVVSWPRPQTVTELTSFLGFCGYYRHFVKDSSKLCRPLNGLLQGYSPKSKGWYPPLSPDKPYLNPTEPFGPRWSEQCEHAFQELKTRLTKAPVLQKSFTIWEKLPSTQTGVLSSQVGYCG